MKVVIENLKPWDGTYDLDQDDEFTRREWGWIKRFAGYLPGDVEKGFDGIDPQLWATFAIIALHRANRIQPGDAPDLFERMQDGGTIRLQGDEVEAEDEADMLPPPEGSSGNGNSSGNGTSTSSETSPGNPLEIGTPGSATSGSALETSLTTRPAR